MNCPECDAPLHVPGACKKCGWGKVETPKPGGGLPMWPGPPPYTPPTAEDAEALRGLIATTAAKLGAAAAPTRRTPMASQPKRCPKCDVGNFVHRGIRYCLDGYLGRHQS